jgi:hypothetical protein
MSLTNKLEIKIRSTLTGDVGLSSVSSVIDVKQSTDLTTVATDAIFTVTGTITGGANSYDLAGSLTDPLGNAVTFAKVMSVYVINNSETDSLTVGGANNIPMLGSGDVMNVALGAYFQYIDETGITVTGGTGDLITITGTDGETFDLVIVGSST